jgi:hypothetical protein
MASERILYICFEPSLLPQRERLFMGLGLTVSAVFGIDGLVGVRNVDEFDCIVLGDEGSPANRKAAVHWLKEEFNAGPMVIALRQGDEFVAGADYQVSTDNGSNWPTTLVECLRRCGKLA